MIACDLAPTYLENEFGRPDVALDDLRYRSDKVLIGRYVQAESREPLLFKISTGFSSEGKIKPHETQPVFRQVGNNNHWLLEGGDDQNHPSLEALINYLDSVQAVQDDRIKQGTGGPLAGISHGTDCNRFVLKFQDQDYFVILDEEDEVLISLAVEDVSKPAFQSVAAELLSYPATNP